MNYRYYIGFN